MIKANKIKRFVFEFFIYLVLLELGLRLGGFLFLSFQEHRNSHAIKQTGTYNILCLGESMTQNQYPAYLEQYLNRRNIGIRFSVIDGGVSGTNTTAILDNLISNLDTYRPDMVITMMGSNDPGEAVSESKVLRFLKTFRVYKLAKLLWLRIVTKFQEIRSVKSGKGSLKSEQSIKLSPQNDDAYVELGSIYREQGKLSKAEAILKKAIKLNPRNSALYALLGGVYRDQSKFSEAEVFLKKAIELNPKNEEAYGELGYNFQDQGKFIDSEALFKKVIELAPNNSEAYGELGGIYREQGKLAEAEIFLKKAIELSPEVYDAYIELGYNYQKQGKFLEAEALNKKAAALNPWQKPGLSYSSIATDNYQKLKAILDKRGIVYVCVQYPMCNLEPLRKIFQSNAKGIIFVDNERIFKEALKQGSYWDYFRDMAGINFGHCSEKGNRLLAENIAHVILKSCPCLISDDASKALENDLILYRRKKRSRYFS